MCDYHTQRAAELEEKVYTRLANVDADALRLVAGNDEGVRAEREGAIKKGKTRLRQLDRRLDEIISAAAKGRITREQLHTLSVTNTSDRLRLEDGLEEIQRRLQEQADASERTKQRERELARLLDGWKSLAIAEKQLLLRELIDRVVVRDEGVEVILRP